ncbi:hypothetical protein WMO27_11210 [Lachnospiraceae bacterium CLA-AA-H183]
MKMYLKFLLSTLLVTLFVFELIVLGILKYPKGVFYSSYQSLIQDKYRILMETNEPKIIIVAGSSSAFGINQDMLEQTCGYKVVNLGLHADFGFFFISELSKANINEGDIILLGYEYNWPRDYAFTRINENLVMSGIDDNIEMYTKIPFNKWPYFIGNIFKYAETKNKYIDATGTYSRESFNSETGQMILPRNSQIEYNPEIHNSIDLTNIVISEESEKYLKEYKNYVENKKAKVYFIAPPVLEDSIENDYAWFDYLKEVEEKTIGISYISNPREYVFPSKLMFDTIYHCNSEGERVRTELLIEDLKRANIEK